MQEIKFTKEQKDYVCYQIGEWYLKWKDRLVDYDDKTHKLGYAKEILKTMICDTQEEKLKFINDIALGLASLPGDE